jgi:hypothetical protein
VLIMKRVTMDVMMCKRWGRMGECKWQWGGEMSKRMAIAIVCGRGKGGMG